MTEFEFQILVWGAASCGGDPLAPVWEQPGWNSGWHIWDHRAGWLENFWINDHRAPEWHCLYYVAKQHLENLNDRF